MVAILVGADMSADMAGRSTNSVLWIRHVSESEEVGIGIGYASARSVAMMQEGRR